MTTPILIEKALFEPKQKICFVERVDIAKGDAIYKNIAEIDAYLAKDHHAYEVIDESDPVRVFMDIDLKYHFQGPSEEYYVLDGDNALTPDFYALDHLMDKRKAMRKFFDDDDWIVVDSSGRLKNDMSQIKLSFHLIHKTLGAKNMSDLRKYIVSQNYVYEGLDMSVYRSYGKFRCPNQSKCRVAKRGNSEDKRLCSIVGKVNILDCLLTTQFKDVIKIDENKFVEPIKMVQKKPLIPSDKKTIPSIEQIREMIEILTQEYSDDREKWIKVKFALKSLSGGIPDDDLFTIWDIFSKKSTKYNRRVVSDLWDATETGTGTTYKSIFLWARKSDEDKYFSIIKKYSDNTSVRGDFMSQKGLYFQSFEQKWSMKHVESLDEWSNDLKRVFGYYSGTDTFILKNRTGYRFHKTPRVLERFNLFLKVDGKDKRLSFKRAMDTVGMDQFSYNDIIFRPNYDNRLFFNLWNGFYAEISDIIAPIDMDLIKPIIDHIKIVLANGDENAYKYIVMWLAHMIKKPEIKNGTLPVFIGDQGCGKNIFSKFLRLYVIGDNLSVVVNDINKITGRFNNLRANKLFVVLDEVSNIEGNYHKTFDILKNIITETHQTIERKGIDTVKVEDYSNYMMFSNNYYPVKVEEGDRRYAIFKCSSEKVGDEAYFDRIGNCMNDKAGQEFFRWLANIDIKGYRLQKNLPNSNIKKEIVIRSLGSDIDFIRELVEKQADMQFMTSAELWTSYKLVCSENGVRQKHKSKIDFCRRYISEFMEKSKKHNKRGYIVDKSKIESYISRKYNISIKDIDI